MPAHTASRTLVKSVPELWAECSEAASLAKHLGSFGEIRITKLEPETAVAWEGDAASGAVRLEPSGWGTRVTLTATAETDAPPLTLEQPPEADPTDDESARPSALARLLSLFRHRPGHEEPAAPQPAEPEPATSEPPVTPREPIGRQDPPAAALDAALDSLGRAHHRPYSRA
jgi:hypothetical protein